MKTYAILAHDKKDSLNHYLFTQITKHLESKNVTVDKLNLYDYEKQIPFYSHDRSKLEKNDFYQENKQRFMKSDSLLIVYPVYWNTVPGILKCWIDLITNFAWKYEGGESAKALHKIKNALVVSTTSAQFPENDPMLNNSVLKNMFKFISIPNFQFYGIGQVDSITKEEIQDHLEKINDKI
ncbi:MAG: NAD(P)H-dependent oxidoreductase [bacterium]